MLPINLQLVYMIGMTTDEAEKYCKQNGWLPCVVTEDAEVTTEWIPIRVNLYVEKGLVVEVSVG